MTNHQKIIFGLKVKQLRTERSLSFAELALASGMSISYLNEIEKGKKYPKDDKISTLAAALDTTAADLTSNVLSRQLAPIGELLRSQFLDDLHLEIYGIDTNKVIEMLADAPTQVGAFISTLMELSRNHSLQQEHFYFAALRSYQELHQNYFEDLEQKADECMEKFGLTEPNTHISTQKLYDLLATEYGYSFDHTTLSSLPELASLRSYFAPESQKLFLRTDLTSYQERFVLAREIAYNYLGIKARNLASSPLEVKSFDHVLDNFRSAYFAVAFLLHRDTMIADLRQFFGQRTWNATAFTDLIAQYEASPEMFFHRMTNLLPRYFGIHELFFLRFSDKTKEKAYQLTKELHFPRLHHPQANHTREHYCRRWAALSGLDNLRQAQKANIDNLRQAQENSSVKTSLSSIITAEHSLYYGTQDQYLCLTIARPSDTKPDTNISVTIGIRATPNALQRIKFMNDLSITLQTVNQTCERCAIKDCAERAAPPRVIEVAQYRKNALAVLNTLR
jgi:XRE family transcriptional regulator, fatty acid utilization regulator